MAEHHILLQGEGSAPEATKDGAHEEEEEEEGLGEDEEEDLHGGVLRGQVTFPKVFKTPTSRDSPPQEWGLRHQTSQVTGPFVEQVQEADEGELQPQTHSVIQEVQSHPQTILSEMAHVQTGKVQPFWLASEFLSNIPIDPQGEFHRDFEILQLQSENLYPSLPPPGKEIQTQKIQNSDVVTNQTNQHVYRHTSIWNGPKPAPQKKVRPLSLSSTPAPQPPAARRRRKKVGETTPLYKEPYRPPSSDTPSSTSRPYDIHRKTRAPVPTLKKKKIGFSSFTSLPVLNHTSQLSTQQQRLCDMMIEGEKEEEEEEKEELVQPPLYSLHTNRKSEKLKSNPKKKQKSNFTYFRKSTKDPEDVCITEQPISPAEDVFSYCKLPCY